MDRIEVSNLNRQFLFRSINVGQPKSVTAAAAARAMNPELKVRSLLDFESLYRRLWIHPPPHPPQFSVLAALTETTCPRRPPYLPPQVAALETPVGEDTEATFDDEFWGSLDVVVNALDNLKARQYVDGRCVFYGLPLLESGTLGTKANCQVIMPHVTESYSDSVDPPVSAAVGIARETGSRGSQSGVRTYATSSFTLENRVCTVSIAITVNNSATSPVVTTFVAVFTRFLSPCPSPLPSRAQEESIPMCTLRNFPHAIEHCIEWARDVFAGSFANAAQDAAAFVADPSAWLAAVGEEGNLSARRGKLEGVATVLKAARGADFALCVRMARESFNSHFYLQIRQLLHNFPLDYTGEC